jgi:uncharacterized protein YutE (UPF0331/DUF86 family)
LLALDEVLLQLAKHAGRGVEAFRDLDERWAVERGLQLCTQAVLDICTHIVASSGRDAPDYASAIEQLGRMDAIPPKLAIKLRPLAGFRNALVHGYIGLDVSRMHAVLNVHLDDVREFARVIDDYVTSTG